MTAPPPLCPGPRFLPLFAVALAVRMGVVALGILLIPVQPAKAVKVFGIAVAGFPADLRPPSEPNSGAEQTRQRIPGRLGESH